MERRLKQFPFRSEPLTFCGLILAISTYTTALFLPVLVIGIDVVEEVFGWQALIFTPWYLVLGLTGEIVLGEEARGLMAWGWLPNPLFFSCLLVQLFGYRRLAWISGALASLLAISWLGFWIMTGSGQDLRVGCYLWLTAMVIATAVGLSGSFRRVTCAPPVPHFPPSPSSMAL